jgi:hypothetical protein
MLLAIICYKKLYLLSIANINNANLAAPGFSENELEE